jgi:hypothetical protein
MLARPIALAVGLVLGFLLSQGPEFAQQYRQRLGGAVDELRRIITQFDEDSARSGFDRRSALALMARNPEHLIQEQGARMEATIARFHRLRDQEEAFKTSGPVVRLVAFVRNYDYDQTRRTFDAYEPAVPATAEGVLLAGGGFLFGYFSVLTVAEIWRRRRSRLQPRNSVSR